MLDKILQDYGLSKTEAQSYLAVLELGVAPVSTIARRSGENRVTVYSALKNLVKKGIAIETPKKKTAYYTVISPEKLIKKMEDKYQAIKDALPQFMAIANKYDTTPQVKFFEWLEWIKQLYDDILSSEKNMIYAFLWVGTVSPKLLTYLNLHFLPQRSKLGIHAKVLLCNEEKKNEYSGFSSSKRFLTEYRVVDSDMAKFHNEINIYGTNKVSLVMFSENEMSGIIIQSEKLHATLKSIFDLVRCIPDQTCFQKKKQTKQKSSLPKKGMKSSTKSSSRKT